MTRWRWAVITAVLASTVLFLGQVAWSVVIPVPSRSPVSPAVLVDTHASSSTAAATTSGSHAKPGWSSPSPSPSATATRSESATPSGLRTTSPSQLSTSTSTSTDDDDDVSPRVVKPQRVRVINDPSRTAPPPSTAPQNEASETDGDELKAEHPSTLTVPGGQPAHPQHDTTGDD